MGGPLGLVLISVSKKSSTVQELGLATEEMTSLYINTPIKSVFLTKPATIPKHEASLASRSIIVELAAPMVAARLFQLLPHSRFGPLPAKLRTIQCVSKFNAC